MTPAENRAMNELTSIEFEWQYESGAMPSLGVFYKQKSFIYPRRATFTASELAGDRSASFIFLLFYYPRGVLAPRRAVAGTHPSHTDASPSIKSLSLAPPHASYLNS